MAQVSLKILAQRSRSDPAGSGKSLETVTGLPSRAMLKEIDPELGWAPPQKASQLNRTE
jgi:hypothetical protein